MRGVRAKSRRTARARSTKRRTDGVSYSASRSVSPGVGVVKWRQGELALAAHQERLPRRRQNPKLFDGLQKRAGDLSRARRDALAAIQHEQGALALGEALGDALLRLRVGRGLAGPGLRRCGRRSAPEFRPRPAGRRSHRDRARAASIASRVFPEPPGPESVTSRAPSRQAKSSQASSSSRPKNRVSAASATDVARHARSIARAANRRDLRPARSLAPREPQRPRRALRERARLLATLFFKLGGEVLEHAAGVSSSALRVEEPHQAQERRLTEWVVNHGLARPLQRTLRVSLQFDQPSERAGLTLV